MKVKVFQSNHKGKIEFTRAELEKLLNEVYTDGYNEGKTSHWTWTSPCLSTSGTSINGKVTTDPYALTAANCATDKIETVLDNSACDHVDAKTYTANAAIDKAPAYAVKVNGTDISKLVNDIFGARASNNVPENVVDAFDKLAKELNF